MSFNEVLYAVEQQVATISFNRPSSLNAMTMSMMEELNQAFELAAKDESVRAIVLTGEGRGFSSGADLVAVGAKPPLDAAGKLDLGHVLGTYYNPLILRMRSLPKPIIAAVNGIAAGAGANLALMADITIAARSASFLQAFVHVGLIPDAGGTWILPRALGSQRAMGLALLGEKLSAEQAQSWGLIWQVIDDDRLMTSAHEIARKLATGPGVAIERIKRSIYSGLELDLAQQLDLERDLQRECGQSEDFAEGATAFAQKRKPQFKNH